MASVKAVAVLIAVVIVAAGVIIVLNDRDEDAPSGVAIGAQVSPGDTYTLEEMYSGAGTSSESKVTYTAQSVEDGMVTYTKTTGDETTTHTGTTDEFLMNVTNSYSDWEGRNTGSEILIVGGQEVLCDIFVDNEYVGNSGVNITTKEWIGQGTNIIYKTEIVVETGSGTEVFTTTLMDTNMIDQGTVPEVPADPSDPASPGGLRDDLQVGDYVKYSVIEHDGGRDIEVFEIVAVNGTYITVLEDYDDQERMTSEGFKAIYTYAGTDSPTGSETISTAYGNVQCSIYEPAFYWSELFEVDDYGDSVKLWVGPDSVIYKAEVTERDDGRYETDVYSLASLTLLSDAPSGDGGSTVDPVTPGASTTYGITVGVGDTYTIMDDDDRYSETSEIIGIEGNRLIVRETQGSHVEIERMSVNDFLEEVMVTDNELSRYTASGTESVDGVLCNKYVKQDGHETETIWVDSNNIVWKELDQEPGDRDEVKTLVSVSLSGL